MLFFILEVDYLCRVATLYFNFLIFLSLHLLSEVLGVAGVNSREKDFNFEIVSFYVLTQYEDERGFEEGQGQRSVGH